MKAIKGLLLFHLALLVLISSCSNLLLPTGEGKSTERAATDVIQTYYEGGLFLKEETGVLDAEAAYKIYLPEGWHYFPPGEKRLVIYAHGYVTPGLEFSQSEELALIQPFIESFVSQGIAVAYSHYGESGWAVASGFECTKNLRNHFVATIGEPDYIYLWGVSEGALISVRLAEKEPALFDGVLAYAGPIGGAKMEFEYILNSRLAFDHFFKNRVKLAARYGSNEAKLLASALGYSRSFRGRDASAIDVDKDVLPLKYMSSTAFLTDMAPFIAKLMIMSPAKAMEMATVKVDGLNLYPLDSWITNRYGFLLPKDDFIPEFAYTMATTLWYNIYGTGDLLGRTGDVMPIDNSESEYLYRDYFRRYERSFTVEVFHSSPEAELFLFNWYQPLGTLTIPLVTLHATRDPAVPFFHQIAYGTIAAGSPWLTQIPIPGFGHGILIDFQNMVPVPDETGTSTYLLGALGELMRQVETP